MGKSTHFIGQPMYAQVIKLLDKSKILQISSELGGERYIKHFNVWIHLTVMLYAVIKRFDSLREITTSLLIDTNKLRHIGITFKIQIWVTLIANLLMMVMKSRLSRRWSFSGLATMIRITLMYYVDFYSLFNNPEKDWEIKLESIANSPPQLMIFD